MVHRIREEFARGSSNPATLKASIDVADKVIELIATLPPEDARRLIKLLRDLLDAVEPRIGAQD